MVLNTNGIMVWASPSQLAALGGFMGGASGGKKASGGGLWGPLGGGPVGASREMGGLWRPRGPPTGPSYITEALSRGGRAEFAS